MVQFQNKKYILLSISGIRLSVLAKFLANDEHKISGSDIKQSKITNDLATNFDAKVTIPHHEDAVEGIELLSRKESLIDILGDKEVYAVGGAHGKSTTSAMLSSVIP